MNRNCLLSSLVFVSLALILGCSQPANGEDKVVTRADKVSDGPARLAGLMGDVRIENAKRVNFAGRSGMWLTADDTIKVPSGGLAVVWLKNSNYLVRIADEVEMRIDDIFLLNAPPTERSMAEQIADLLTPDEQKNAERIVGWRAGMRGAETVGHKREKRKEEKEEKVALLEVASEESMAPPEPREAAPMSTPPSKPKAKAKQVAPPPVGSAGGPGAGAVAGMESAKLAAKSSKSKKENRRRSVSKVAPRKRSRAKLDDGFKDAEGVQDKDALDDAAPKPAKTRAVVWMRVVSRKLVTQEGPAPEVLQLMAEDQKLKQMLRKLLNDMSQKHIPALEIRLRLRSGKVTGVWIQGGLPVPKYLREMVIDKSVSGQPDGWVVLELGLR
ncbi:MAG: hypothetical protein JRF33_02670 [Deltaproteobacteria bacterium]|nr:hypothetical protein [Deltaproteobacteria bacterium]